MHELVDETDLQRFLRAEFCPVRIMSSAARSANEARQPLRSTAPGNETELNFREARASFSDDRSRCDMRTQAPARAPPPRQAP